MENHTVSPVEIDNTVPAAETAAETAAESVVEPAAETAADNAAPKKKNAGLIAVLCVLGALVLAVAGIAVSILLGVSGANNLLEQGKYQQAKEAYQKYSFLSWLSEMPKECDYLYAGDLLESGDYTAAADYFTALGDYKDSSELRKEAKYQYGLQLIDDGKLIEADPIFADIWNYRDSLEQRDKCLLAKGMAAYEQGDYNDAAAALSIIKEKSDEAELYYALCRFQMYKEEGFFRAEKAFNALLPFADNPLVAEALADPYFFEFHFYCAEWHSNFYYMIGNNFKRLYDCYLPWDAPGGTIYLEYSDYGLDVYVEDTLWFTIAGFSSYDVVHPERMYILSPDRKDLLVFTFDHVVNEWE